MFGTRAFSNSNSRTGIVAERYRGGNCIVDNTPSPHRRPFRTGLERRESTITVASRNPAGRVRLRDEGVVAFSVRFRPVRVEGRRSPDRFIVVPGKVPRVRTSCDCRRSGTRACVRIPNGESVAYFTACDRPVRSGPCVNGPNGFPAPKLSTRSFDLAVAAKTHNLTQRVVGGWSPCAARGGPRYKYIICLIYIYIYYHGHRVPCFGSSSMICVVQH